MVPDDCWGVGPAVVSENVLAWSIWCLFDRHWNVAPMGGVIGWSGYSDAMRLLIDGYAVRGAALVSEMHRLNVLEDAQLEIETARRKKEEADRKRKKQNPEAEDDDSVAGDMSGFYDDEETHQ